MDKPGKLAVYGAIIDCVILSEIAQKDSYGYEIIQCIREDSDGAFDLKEPFLYQKLKRMAEAGLIAPYWGTEPRESRRRYWKITPNGQKQYVKLRAEWQQAKAYMDNFLK